MHFDDQLTHDAQQALNRLALTRYYSTHWFPSFAVVNNQISKAVILPDRAKLQVNMTT
jgi:hypothetical protein